MMASEYLGYQAGSELATALSDRTSTAGPFPDADVETIVDTLNDIGPAIGRNPYLTNRLAANLVTLGSIPVNKVTLLNLHSELLSGFDHGCHQVLRAGALDVA